MSDAVHDSFDVREQLARIDRMLAESGKFQAEQNKLAIEQSKLAAEQLKFAAEQNKLMAEADKLRRDRWLAPGLAIAALIGSVGTIAITIARAFNWLP